VRKEKAIGANKHGRKGGWGGGNGRFAKTKKVGHRLVVSMLGGDRGGGVGEMPSLTRARKRGGDKH